MNAAVVRTFEQLELVIEGGLQTFIDVGQALLEIRDRKLYREEYRTFEEYCTQRWGWKRAHAYRLMDAAEVVGNLSPMGDKSVKPMGIIPQNERQIRPLVPLPPEDQRAVWAAAVEAANGSQPTAKYIMTEVLKRVEAAIAPPPEPPDPEREREEKALREKMRANSEWGVKLFTILDSITALASPKLPIAEVAQWLKTNDGWGDDWRGQTPNAVKTLTQLLKEFS